MIESKNNFVKLEELVTIRNEKPHENHNQTISINSISDLGDITQLNDVKSNINQKVIHTNDILIPIVNPLVNSGKITVVDEMYDNKTCNNSVFIVLTPNLEINPYFLEFVLKTPTIQKQIEGITYGNTLSRIKISELKSLQIRMPEPETCNKIGKIWKKAKSDRIKYLNSAKDALLIAESTIEKLLN